MNKILKRTFVVIIYFLFWIVLYSIFYTVVYYNGDIVLLPQFKISHKLAVASIAFIKYLPALEIAAILILFTISASNRSVSQLKRHSNVTISLITKLFVLCIVASFINITMSEIVRPMLIDMKNSNEILSQKYYENINNASSSINREDYDSAQQYVNMALLIWEHDQQALSLKEQIASLKPSNIQNVKETQNTGMNKFITIPESLDAKEILNMAKTRAKMLDFYTANHYANLVLQIAKDDQDLRKEAISIQEMCVKKIVLGVSTDEMSSIQKQFEAKKMAYDALTQEDYAKAYYSFLKLHDDLLNTENKYDPDVEKYLALAKQKLSEETFFIEDFDESQTFNSGYNIQFFLKDKNTHFNIGSFYFHTTKNTFDIHLSNVLYSTHKMDGSLISQIKFPYAKIIEKKVDNKSRLYMLVSAISKYNPSKELTTFTSPIDLEMTLEDFNLIILAQKGTKSMTIGDLYKFIPVSENYGFDRYIYQAELCIRFADFFLFIIFTLSGAVIAFNLRTLSPDRCIGLLLLACFVFPYPLYVLFEIVRYIFKLLATLIINTGIAFPNVIALTLLLFALIITTYFLYNIGYDEGELKAN